MAAGIYIGSLSTTIIKIRKTAEEKVTNILSSRKELLRRAVFCVIESISKDPDKYGPLIYYNDDTINTSSIPTTTTTIAEYYNSQYYSRTHGGGQPQQHYLTKDSFKQAYIDILREEVEKLFTSLEKIMVDETIDEHASKTSAASLPMLPFDDKRQQKSYP